MAPTPLPPDAAAAPDRLDGDRALRILRGVDEAFWELDVRTQEMWLSPRFFHMLGLPVQADRANINNRIHPDDQPRFEAVNAEARRLCLPYQYDLRYLDGAGRWRWLRTIGRVWPGADGLAERSVGLIQDIDAEKTARQDLALAHDALEARVAERTEQLRAALEAAEAARERAEAAGRAKSVFLAHMSHELRTPLNGLLGLTELALGEAASPAQRRYLEVALASGRTLLEVIHDVLQLARLDGAELPLDDEPFDIGELVADAMRSTVPLLGTRPVAVRYDVEGGPTALRGDAGRLRQIAVNLVGNAAKFTESGQITVTLHLVPQDGGRTVNLRLDVADTGPGMAPEVAAQVFEPFFQGDTRLSRRHGGTGLGLSIARGLARAMGGDLTVQSALGEGAVFTLQLRLPVQADAPAPAPLPPGRAWLLFASDDGGEWVARRVRRTGWQAEVMTTLQTLCDRAAAGAAPGAAAPDAPDLVVMASAGAFAQPEALAQLRGALPHTPLRMLIRADWAEPLQEQSALAQGVQTVLTPLSPLRLHELLREALPRSPAAAPAPARAAEAEAHVLLVEDNPTNQLIGQHMLRYLGHRVSCADDGIDALSACEAGAPDLVIMDVRMPRMDGLEATRRLRALQAEGRLPRFPVLGLSAHALDADRQAALEAGMDDYLTKPIAAETLRDALQRWLPARPTVPPA